MAADDLTICNMALAEIGQDPQTSLGGSTKTINLLNLFYAPLRDEVLVSHPWNFAAKRAVLTLGGMAAATVADGGGSGTPGAVTLTGTTGAGLAFQATGTIDGGGVLSGDLVVTVAGNYTTAPANLDLEPVTGGGLVGAIVALTPVAPAPAWEFTHAYPLPADCLKVLKVNTAAGFATLPWKVEGRTIVTDLAAPILVQYTAQVTDTTAFPPAFTLALVKRLAQELAEPIAQSASLADQLGAEYEALLHRARGINAAEGTPDRLALDVQNIILAKIALARGDLGKDGEIPRPMLYDPTRSIELINAVYAAVRDEVLTAHPWNFSLKRTVLTLGGMASASVASGGTDGTPGAVTLTGTTGTGTKFQATGTIDDDGVLSGAVVVTVAGDYTLLPDDLAAEPVTGGGLVGATVTLTPVVEQPAWQWSSAFYLPLDCLKAWRVETTTAGDTEPWKVEGARIVTDMAAPLNLLYIARVTDTETFSPSFRMALVTRLAQEVARATPEGPAIADQIGKDYLALLTQARMIDVGEGTPDRYITEIENLAVGKLGPKAQAILVGPSNISMLLLSLFPALRDEVMAAHPWNFALKRATSP